MNQGNNIIGYDSQTGQPMYANQNIENGYTQQPVSPIYENQNMGNGYTQQPVQPPKKGNKILIIIALLVVIGVVGVVLYFNNQDKKELTNNEDKKEITNNETNSNNQNETENNNSTGSVGEGTNTTYDENGAFLFRIEDVFIITGRGTVVTGRVDRGKVKVGDTVQIVGLNVEPLTTAVIGIEMFRQTKDEAIIGDNVGILLRGIAKEQVQIGQVLAKPNSIEAATKFDADVHMLSKTEGGRHTPFFNNYRPQFNFRAIDITGIIELPEDIEMVGPGENASLTVELISPIAMEVGTEFSIREGGRTVGTGIVTKVY